MSRIGLSGCELIEKAHSPTLLELLRVKIISDRGPSTAILVLKELSRRNRHGHYIRMSADDLAWQLKTPGGVGAITSSVQTIRRNITQRLHRDFGLEVAKDGVIGHDDQGYCLRDWMSVASRRTRRGRRAWHGPDLRQSSISATSTDGTDDDNRRVDGVPRLARSAAE